MEGIVGFENHRISCIIGVNPDERMREQVLLVDLKVWTDFTKCVLSDDVADALNYDSLAAVCTEIAQTGAFRLVEKYAAEVLETLFNQYPMSEAWIKVKKPGAIATADCAIVELSKTRKM